MKSGNQLKGGFTSIRLLFSVLLNHQVCIFECNIISTTWGITLVTLKLTQYGTPWKSELKQTEMDQRASSGDYIYRQKFNVQLFDFNGGVLSTEWLYPITRQILSDNFNSGYMTRDMRYEWARFLSFLDFPSSMSRSCIRLAQAGFYYNSNDGKVHCFSCGITHDGILTSGNPSGFHNHISPECPFMLGRETENVPIHSSGDVSHDTGTPQARQHEGLVNENIPGLTNEQPSRDMTVSEHTTSDQRPYIHNSPTVPVQSNSDMTVTEHTTSDQMPTIHNSPTVPVQSNSDMTVTEHSILDQSPTIHNSPTVPVQSNSDMTVTEHSTSDQRPTIHNSPTVPVQSNSDMTVTEHSTSDQRPTIHNSPTVPVQSNSDMTVTEHSIFDQSPTIHNSPTVPVQSNSDMTVTEHSTSDQRPTIHNSPTVPVQSNSDMTVTEHTTSDQRPTIHNSPTVPVQSNSDMTVTEHSLSDQRPTIHNSPTVPVQSNSDMTVTEHSILDQSPTIHNSPSVPVQSNSDMTVTDHSTSDQRPTIHNSPTVPVQSNSDMTVTEHSTSDQRPTILHSLTWPAYFYSDVTFSEHSFFLGTIYQNSLTRFCPYEDMSYFTGIHIHLAVRNRNGTHRSHPAHPRFTTETSRLATFTNSPRIVTQSRESLARAGFFYSGLGDLVRCFFCGGCLRGWEAGDDPWTEHARWFPHCTFLHKHKGRAHGLSVQQTEGENSTFMSQPAALAMLSMGYSEREIIQAYEALMAEFSSVDEISAMDLMDYMFRQEDIEHNVPQNDISSLVREIEDLKKQRLCKVCLDEQITIVFLPCAHLVCCHLCSQRLTTCPVCRSNITSRLNVYMA